MLKAVSFLVAFSASFAVAQVKPSIGTSLDIRMIEQAKDAYFDYILSKLNGMTIPNVNFNHGHMNGNTFAVQERGDEVAFELDEANNAIKLSVK